MTEDRNRAAEAGGNTTKSYESSPFLSEAPEATVREAQEQQGTSRRESGLQL